MRKMHLFVDLFHQADYACGWALLYRWYERYDRHDSIQVSEEDLEDLPSWRYTLVQDVLAKSTRIGKRMSFHLTFGILHIS